MPCAQMPGWSSWRQPQIFQVRGMQNECVRTRKNRVLVGDVVRRNVMVMLIEVPGMEVGVLW